MINLVALDSSSTGRTDKEARNMWQQFDRRPGVDGEGIKQGGGNEEDKKTRLKSHGCLTTD